MVVHKKHDKVKEKLYFLKEVKNSCEWRQNVNMQTITGTAIYIILNIPNIYV